MPTLSTLPSKNYSYNEIFKSLSVFCDKQRSKRLAGFFKTNKGDYGEGDLFLGIYVPQIRSVAHKYEQANFKTLIKLLDSKWHECRLLALIILSTQYRVSQTEKRKIEILNLYLSKTNRINNWDLVDISCPKIVGAYCFEFSEFKDDILNKLAKSPVLWERRIAIVSNWYLIRKGDYLKIYSLTKKLINDPEPLMHKAMGWMLREAGKKDKALLTEFLNEYASKMPRTMLRYSIEKFSKEERQFYLHLKPKKK